MAEKSKKLYLELQMEELKSLHGETETSKGPSAKVAQKMTENKKNYNSKNAEIARMYKDAAEYEADLKGFEDELAVVNANDLQDIAAALTKKVGAEDRDYGEELNTIVRNTWTQYVEVDKSHPKEQLEYIQNTDFTELVSTFETKFPEYTENFADEVRGLLVKRWEMLIAIKKEHIAEELAEIKTTGLKPKYVQRIYKQFHGLI